MKNILPLFLVAGLLSGCAPAIEQRVMTDSVTYVYTSSCSQVLTALESAAIGVRPGLTSESSWSTLDLQKREGSRRVFMSRESHSYLRGGADTPKTITTTASCVEAKGSSHLTLSSEGEIKPYLTQLHRMIYDAIRLP